MPRGLSASKVRISYKYLLVLFLMVGSQTKFQDRQCENRSWADYSGGDVVSGYNQGEILCVPGIIINRAGT